MKRIVLTLLLILYTTAVAQDSTQPAPEFTGLRRLTQSLGLTPDDIGFRDDYTDLDSFRLDLVANLMHKPLGMIDYTASLRQAHVQGQPEILSRIMFEDLAWQGHTGRSGFYKASAEEIRGNYNLYYSHLATNELLSRASYYLNIVIPKSTEMALARLTAKERKFLLNEFKFMLTMREEDEQLSAEAMDSLEQLEEKYAQSFALFGSKIDKDPVIAAGIECLRDILLQVRHIQGLLDSNRVTPEALIKSGNPVGEQTDRQITLGQQTGWKIGGPGNDYYTGDYTFILDLGGDDVYDLTYDPAKPHPVLIIDLGGNDSYRGKSDFTVGSGCLSVGLLLDFGGDDRYDCKSFGLGSGYFGFGLLYDAAGDDCYDGDTHVEGAASFGLGLLIDEGGRDTYRSAVYSQGFGFTQGAGIIYDMAGNDLYFAGGKYKDILRYEDRYLSLSQGFGQGLRPYLSGGIGAIVDLTGNDQYFGDIFAQGASYWWGLGVLYDSSGNDSYSLFQYGQGCATHMTVGILVDDFGNDVYFGKGLMQGCGHDYSCGMLLDRHGNDTYTAYDLSQGAGSANGVGILADNEGDDRYFAKNYANTQGYGNPRRDYGSIGLFIDLGGLDQYAGNGKDNFYWQSKSVWGGGLDIQLTPPPDTTTTTGAK